MGVYNSTHGKLVYAPTYSKASYWSCYSGGWVLEANCVPNTQRFGPFFVQKEGAYSWRKLVRWLIKGQYQLNYMLSIHNTSMKNTIYALILPGLASILLSCQRVLPELDLLLDGKPRIKSITFNGIPSQNVIIDQEKLLVTITLPATITSFIPTSLVLTDSAKLNAPINWDEVFLKTPEQCPACFKISLTHQNNAQSNPGLLTTYTIKLRPDGPLTIQPSPSNSIFDSSPDVLIHLSMFHLYGNALPTKAIFVNQLTGERVAQDSIPLPNTSFSSPAVSKGYHNVLTINPNYFSKLIPGQFMLELTTATGQLLRQSVSFTKASQYIYRSSLYQSQPGEWVTLLGSSLYESDVSLSLLDSLDRATPITDVIYDRYGHQLQFRMPATIAHQRYLFRVTNRDTGKHIYCLRLNWPTRENIPNEIYYLSDRPDDCSMSGPVYLWKGGTVLSFEANAYRKVGQLKLIPIENSTKHYLAYVQLRTSDPGQLPGALLPADIPSGRYKVYLQIIDPQDKTKVLEEGPAFWRDVEVR